MDIEDIDNMTKKQILRNIKMNKIKQYTLCKNILKKHLMYMNKPRLYSLLNIQNWVLPFFERKNLPFDIEIVILSYIL
jgi:hypothetical protein